MLRPGWDRRSIEGDLAPARAAGNRFDVIIDWAAGSDTTDQNP